MSLNGTLFLVFAVKMIGVTETSITTGIHTTPSLFQRGSITRIRSQDVQQDGVPHVHHSTLNLH